ncbi:MAG: RNA 2',3'-cyclic phosphodiesterase [Candidatus Aenigmatarchaeota archaeon]|nr:RNA 2',3'-cyclic phosphodiesterase [Candidatus Aenigmarchaeota archaeon]
MRLFIGINIPENIKKKILEIQEKLKDADIKLVEPENLHICLKFLGEVDENQIENIKKSIDNVCNNYKSFEIRLNKLNFFPNENFIRVVFIELENPWIIKSMMELLDTELNKYGFEKEKRDYIPHITLGRVKNIKNKENFLKITKNIKINEIININEIKLFSSKLTQKGPIYSIIYSKKLL